MNFLKQSLMCFLFIINVSLFADIRVSDSFCSSSFLGEGPKVKVLLLDNVSSCIVEVKGGYKVVNVNEDKVINIGANGRRCSVHSLYGGVHWGELFPFTTHIIIEPTSETDFVFINGLQYKGKVHIVRGDNCLFTVMNEVSVEDFLKASLSLKYLYCLPKEALSALMIVERTNFYEKLLRAEEESVPWHVVGKEENYFGYGNTHRLCGIEESIDWTYRMIIDGLPDDVVLQPEVILERDIVELAKSGYNAKEILETFYPEAKFVVVESWDKVDTWGIS